jgi:hypothetical protein
MAKTGLKVKYQGKYKPATFHEEILIKQLRKHEDNIRGALQTHGKEVKKELRKVISTSVGNGRHYSGLPNRSSSAGSPPVSQSGDLEKLFSYKTTPLFLTIFNTANNKGAPYPTFLEEGTKKMQARPYFECTVIALHYRLEKDLYDLTN